MNILKIKPKVKDGLYNAIIEIPLNAPYVKYEYDKTLSIMKVDRFMMCPMFYPCNYGFIPSTLGNDGDPVDILLVSYYPVNSGALIEVRPIGVLIMEDESGMDEKIIAVASKKTDQSLSNVDSLDDLENSMPMIKKKIMHFFSHYKELDDGKWVKIHSFEGREKAIEIIDDAIENYSE